MYREYALDIAFSYMIGKPKSKNNKCGANVHAPLQSVLFGRFAFETDAFAEHHNLAKHGRLRARGEKEKTQLEETIEIENVEKTFVSSNCYKNHNLLAYISSPSSPA